MEDTHEKRNTIYWRESRDLKLAFAEISQSHLPSLILPSFLQPGQSQSQIDEALLRNSFERLSLEFEKDPMLGFVALCDTSLESPLRSPLPRSYCLLIRPELLQEFFSTACHGLEDPREILLTLVLLANQVGYGVKSLPLLQGISLEDPLQDRERLSRLTARFPGLESALWSQKQSHRLSVSETSPPRPRVVFDFLSISPIFNGTTEVALQLLRCISLSDELCVSILAEPKTAEFFEISREFPLATVYHSPQEVGDADIAVSLCQPTTFSQLAQIEALAPRRCYIFHDSIAYDCLPIRARIPALEAVYQKMAMSADLIVFPSEFSKKIFAERFSDLSAENLMVNHLSFSPLDYLSPLPGQSRGEVHPVLEKLTIEKQTLVLGNQFYVHKGIAPCVELLGERFPEQEFCVLGLLTSDFANVSPLPSGMLSWNAIDRLIRKSRCVIIPSFYEGFGLPLFHALSRRKVVFVRDSELVRELLPLWKGPGKVVIFRNTSELGGRLQDFYAAPSTGEDCDHPPASVSRDWQEVGDDLSKALVSLARKPASEDCLSNYLSSYALSMEPQVLDTHLRRSIVEREMLRDELIRLDENLRIAITQRDALRAEVETLKQERNLLSLRIEQQTTLRIDPIQPPSPLNRFRNLLQKYSRSDDTH